MIIALFALAVVIGITLGLLGAGGAILAVPAFVYLGGISPTLASGYALFVVTVATAVASIPAWRTKRIVWRAFWAFGSTTMMTIFLVRSFVMPQLPDVFHIGTTSILRDTVLMIAFAMVLLIAGISMLRTRDTLHKSEHPHIMWLAFYGIIIGIIAGFLGVGGGFLMTPALVLWARLDMRYAVGTSLALICVNSAVGVVGDLSSGVQYDWVFVGTFAALATAGILIGMMLSHRIQVEHLKRAFGWLVIAIGITVLAKELL